MPSCVALAHCIALMLHALVLGVLWYSMIVFTRDPWYSTHRCVIVYCVVIWCVSVYRHELCGVPCIMMWCGGVHCVTVCCRVVYYTLVCCSSACRGEVWRGVMWYCMVCYAGCYALCQCAVTYGWCPAVDYAMCTCGVVNGGLP